MPSLNKVLLMGNLVRDPELRVTPRGTSICQFGIAVNRTFKMESGEQREEVIFVDIEAWGKQGETIAKYCTKGKPLYVEGRLRLDTWDDSVTKQKRSKMKVVLEQFQFLGNAERPAGAATPATTELPASTGGFKNLPGAHTGGVDFGKINAARAAEKAAQAQGLAQPAAGTKPLFKDQNLDEDVPF